jgi:hypothetical protein
MGIILLDIGNVLLDVSAGRFRVTAKRVRQ